MFNLQFLHIISLIWWSGKILAISFRICFRKRNKAIMCDKAHEIIRRSWEMFDIPFEYGEIFTIIMYFAPALISLVP